MDREFFFSYTRGNNDPYLKKFFDDLSEEVSTLRGLPADAETFRKALAAALKPVIVTSPEPVTQRSDGDVRYFFDDDEAFARKVSNSAELLLAKQGVRARLKLLRLDAKDFAQARSGTIELWLPSLTTTQPLPRPEFVQRPLNNLPAQAPIRLNARPELYKK